MDVQEADCNEHNFVEDYNEHMYMVLLSYAIHKVDPVFIVGQSCGFLIYSRNIYLIKKEGKNKKNDPSKIMKVN